MMQLHPKACPSIGIHIQADFCGGMNYATSFNFFKIRNHYLSELCPKFGFLPTTAAYLVIWLLLVCVAEENNGDGGDEEVDHAKVGVVHREEYWGTGLLLVTAGARVGKVHRHADHSTYVPHHDAIKRTLVVVKKHGEYWKLSSNIAKDTRTDKKEHWHAHLTN